MCRPDDSPPYDVPECFVPCEDLLGPSQVRALAVAMSGSEAPEWPIIEHAELFLLRLAVRGWVLVNVDEDGSQDDCVRGDMAYDAAREDRMR